MEMAELLPYIEYFMLFIVGVLVILWGISIYFVKTEKMTGYRWSLRSLGLPQGSVRAIIAFVIMFLVAIAMMHEGTVPDLPDWLVGILGTVIGFYFGTALVPRPTEAAPKSEEGETKDSGKVKNSGETGKQ